MGHPARLARRRNRITQAPCTAVVVKMPGGQPLPQKLPVVTTLPQVDWFAPKVEVQPSPRANRREFESGVFADKSMVRYSLPTDDKHEDNPQAKVQTQHQQGNPFLSRRKFGFCTDFSVRTIWEEDSIQTSGIMCDSQRFIIKGKQTTYNRLCSVLFSSWSK